MFLLRGHNRPPFRPKVPGTDLRSDDVPTAVIYRPARSVERRGLRPRRWVLEFEPHQAQQIEPLMGWTASKDPFRPIRMTFPDRESAIAFAERNDWRYLVLDTPDARNAALPRRFWWEQAPTMKGAEAPGAWRVETHRRPTSSHRLYRGVDAIGARDFSRETDTGPGDPVIEAGIESFPASDPPAWTGASLCSRGVR